MDNLTRRGAIQLCHAINLRYEICVTTFYCLPRYILCTNSGHTGARSALLFNCCCTVFLGTAASHSSIRDIAGDMLSM